MGVSIRQAEKYILAQVKFLNYVLKELRERNKILKNELGPTYGKLLGLSTPYEEAIHSLRQVKAEIDQYLQILRMEITRQYEEELKSMKRRRKRPKGSRIRSVQRKDTDS